MGHHLVRKQPVRYKRSREIVIVRGSLSGSLRAFRVALRAFRRELWRWWTCWKSNQSCCQFLRANGWNMVWIMWYPWWPWCILNIVLSMGHRWHRLCVQLNIPEPGYKEGQLVLIKRSQFGVPNLTHTDFLTRFPDVLANVHLFLRCTWPIAASHVHDGFANSQGLICDWHGISSTDQ